MISEEENKRVTAVIEELDKADVISHALDEAVGEAHRDDARLCNELGRMSQVCYLLRCGRTPEEIVRVAKMATSDLHQLEHVKETAR